MSINFMIIMLLPIKTLIFKMLSSNAMTVFHGLLTVKCLTYISTLPLGYFIYEKLYLFLGGWPME